MKKITKTIVALSVLAAVASCAKEISPVNSNSDNNGGIALSLTAGQEGVETRAAAGETVTDESGKKTTPVLWSENDAISVFDGNNTNCKLTLDAADAGKSAGEFSGLVSKTSDGYTALYPYQEGASYDGTKISGVTLKSEQTATAGGFDPEAALMCAQSTTSDGALSFKNAVGYAKLTTDFECSKITLVSNTASDVFTGTADMTPGDTPTVSVTSGSASQVSLIPASGSATIAAGTYYIAMMPGTFAGGIKLVFTMNDSSKKFKKSTNSLEISCSGTTNLGTIHSAELMDDGLSANGTANCYLIQKAGSYKFLTVKGNSDESVGTVDKVEVLWESDGTATAPTTGAIIASAEYSDGYIQFSTPSTFKEGNAVIAARDASNNILWSWHIWCATEKWTEQVYNNSAGTMMDRNLGATTATAGEVGSLGLLYQWGRKDPFLGSSSVSSSTQAVSTGTWATSSDAMTADNTTQNPTTFYTGYSNGMPDDSWGWTSTGTTKAVNDPCPAGWRVPDGGESGIWAKASGQTSNFSINAGTYGMDFNSTFGTGSTTTIWYPASGYLNVSGGLLDVNNYGEFWSVTPDPSYSSYAYCLSFNSNGTVYPSETSCRSGGRAVRCCKE